jgi:Domain of unknown function (DUF4118)
MLPLVATHLLKLPLVAPVIVSAIPLGFGPGLLAVVLATLWADYRYALPEYDFAITEWEDVAGLAGPSPGVCKTLFHRANKCRWP